MTRILSEEQKERNRERAKLYYQKNKEKLIEYGKKRRKRFKNIINKKQRDARANDPNKIEKYKRARQLPRQRWHQFKKSAINRDKNFSITYDQFIELIDKPCYYCNNELGEKSKTGSGLDRKDNNLGYEIDNVVTCCTFCNKLKSNIFNEKEMIAIANMIILIRNKNSGIDFSQQENKIMNIIKMASVY